MDYQEKELSSSESSLSLSDILQVLKQRWLVIGIVTVVFFVAGYLYVKAQPDTYTAQSTYIVYAKDTSGSTDTGENGMVGDDIISSLSSADISRGKSFKILYVEDLSSNNTLPNAIRTWLAVAYGYTEETLPSASKIRGMLNFSTTEESYFFFTATVSSVDKKLTMDVNAALADIISDAYRGKYEYGLLVASAYDVSPLTADATEAEKAAFITMLAEYDVPCEDPVQFSSDLVALKSRITIDDTNRARYLNYMRYDATPIEGSSIYPRDASESPKVSGASSILIAVIGVIGFVAASAVFILIRVFDTKIRSEEDLRKHCSYPTLAIIPAMHIHRDRGGNRS